MRKSSFFSRVLNTQQQAKEYPKKGTKGAQK
ncbi:hypothetical protein EFD32_0115 [Enterococcus faecalis D32]|nr:hypothetical protein EFD32_0115 [Enterococcus faecalis D32]